jgi:hypothetical protein
MLIAPIVLFVYARPVHVQQAIDALLKNALSIESDLIIFSDGASGNDKTAEVGQVRAILENIQGFRSKKIYFRESNYGLSKSIIDGVSHVLEEYDRVIVLEDDLIVSPHFLQYMNEALDIFSNNDQVVSIHGYVYPTSHSLPQAFFLRGADCWGWATWRRGWQIFIANGEELLKKLVDSRSTWEFDFDGTYPYTEMLRNQIAGKNSSWAVRWYASAFLAGKLTLYPGRSLVHNIGNDKSGTHGGNDRAHDTEVSGNPIDLTGVTVNPSTQGRIAFKSFFKNTQSSYLRRLVRKIYYKLHQYIE